jgi:hypothetical protein
MRGARLAWLFTGIALAGYVALGLSNVHIGYLVLYGTLTGAGVGGVRSGGPGVFVGAVLGGFLAILLPILYLPFWLVFDLPPYPEVPL